MKSYSRRLACLHQEVFQIPASNIINNEALVNQQEKEEYNQLTSLQERREHGAKKELQ